MVRFLAASREISTRSRVLANDLGISLPVEGLIGYWTGLPDHGTGRNHTVFYPAGGFGMTPHENTLAVAGTVEIAGPAAAAKWRRADDRSLAGATKILWRGHGA